MPKSFRTIKESECVPVAFKVIRHAKSKWRDSERLVSAGSYGSALTMKICALEELAKALVLIIDSKGFQFRKLKHLKVLDKDHQQRHAVVMVAAGIDILGKEVVKGIHWLKENQGSIGKWLFEQGAANAEVVPLLQNYYYNTLGPMLVKHAEWASILSELRSEGIYSEFNGELRAPHEMSAEDFRVKAERIDSAYNAMRWACAVFCRDKDLNNILAPAAFFMNNPVIYKELDELLAMHFRTRQIFDNIITRVKETLVQPEEAVLTE